MKCSKCGAECKDNQAFCLKCGTPIQVVPDFNLIEAELASNVGEMLDEIQSEEKGKTNKYSELDYLDDEHYDSTDTMPTKAIEAEISFDEYKQYGSNRNSSKTKPEENDFQVDSSDFTDEKSKTSDVDKEKKIFKIKVAILCVIVAIAIVIATLFLSNINKSSNSEFTKKYNSAYDYYTAKDYEKAAAGFVEARDEAESSSEKIKVNKSLLAAYEKIDGSDDKMIDVLKELIELQPSEYEYYEKLVKLYDKNSKTQEIEDLVNSITDTTISAKLSDYSVASPQFSQEAGTYDSYISLTLSSTGNNTIYYTIDGTEPTLQSTVFSDPINLNTEGTITVKAFAANEKGITSKVVSKTYEINPSVIEGPEVSPSGGTFTEETKITVNVPDGMKCYYTYDENGTSPTAGSTQYTEPISMKRGKYIFSAILVSASGTVSEVTQNVYQLNIQRTVQYDDALKTVQKYLVDNGIARVDEDNKYIKTNGSELSLSYNCITYIDENEYYIITSNEKTSTGAVVEKLYYGVDTVTGQFTKVIQDTANSGQYKLTE